VTFAFLVQLVILMFLSSNSHFHLVYFSSPHTSLLRLLETHNKHTDISPYISVPRMEGRSTRMISQPSLVLIRGTEVETSNRGINIDTSLLTMEAAPQRHRKMKTTSTRSRRRNTVPLLGDDFLVNHRRPIGGPKTHPLRVVNVYYRRR
jgi:hypothetical protein